MASPETPVYRKSCWHGESATPVFIVVCDEGWRESIVCDGMYEWAADWLIGVLQGRPYAPEHRPDRVQPSDGDR